MAQVLVVGSANVDYRTRVAALPRPGETVLASQLKTFTGGKGANQAIAAACVGADVTFIGGLGADAQSRFVLEELQQEGVRTLVQEHPDAATGQAYITVDASGQNQIVVAPGANQALSIDHALGCLVPIEAQEAILVACLETPLKVIDVACAHAHSRGWEVVLNPAPAVSEAERLLKYSPILTPNAEEALQLSGATTLTGAGDRLRAITNNHVIITDGEHGALHFDRDGTTANFPPPSVEVVDTTGAGDTLTGVLAGLLSQGATIHEAIAWAVVAAARSVTADGARGAMPHWTSLLKAAPIDLEVPRALA